jgi:hypothetical protein
MQIPKILIAACSLSLLAALPVVAEDFTIGLSIYPKPSTTTLFVSSSNVRYRTRHSYFESQDWIFNVADERLVVIDHEHKIYYETSAQDRAEIRRLAREYDGEKRGSTLRDDKPLVEIKPCKREDDVTIEFLRAPPPRLAPTSADAIPRIEHCEVLTISVKVRSDWAPDRTRILADWLVTADIQAPEFFKFVDAVLEEDDDPPWRMRGEAWIEAFDEIRSKGLFPLGVHYHGDPSTLYGTGETPTYGARDLLSNPISWGSFWIRKGAIDPAVFTILKEGNSVLSPILPASYNKIDSPVVRGIASLKTKIESDRQFGERRQDVGKDR